VAPRLPVVSSAVYSPPKLSSTMAAVRPPCTVEG
jgi:hypothetical protein